MLNASRAHLNQARALEADGALAEAAQEYRIASKLDPSNSYAAGRALERGSRHGGPESHRDERRPSVIPNAIR